MDSGSNRAMQGGLINYDKVLSRLSLDGSSGEPSKPSYSSVERTIKTGQSEENCLRIEKNLDNI